MVYAHAGFITPSLKEICHKLTILLEGADPDSDKSVLLIDLRICAK